MVKPIKILPDSRALIAPLQQAAGVRRGRVRRQGHLDDQGGGVVGRRVVAVLHPQGDGVGADGAERFLTRPPNRCASP